MPSDYRVFVANYMPKGEEFSLLPDGKRIRNLTRLRLNGFDLELVRTPESFDLAVGEAKNRFNYTLDVIVRNVRPEQRKRLDKLIDEVLELLSFATSSQVCRFGHEYEGQTTRRSVRGLTLWFRPPLGPTQGSEIRRFLELTWPGYHALRTKRQLHIVFDYIMTSELPVLPIEFGMLGVFVTLECLKSTYAKLAGYRLVAGAWRRVSVPPRPNPRNEPAIGFEALLKEMLRKQGMRKPLRRIVQLRNHIVHNGFSRRPLQSQLRGSFDSKEIIREYLLRLLGYSGPYRRYNDMKENLVPALRRRP